jgi:AcrR family transcriptional regulator
MPVVTRERRTQAQRRAATRVRLLNATVACLADIGYARTSTTEIVRRAGVSRGAQVHHFPTKADLVARALDHVFERRIGEFRAAFAQAPQDEHRAVAAIDLLWSMFEGPTFDAWLELAVAARTEPELQARLTAVTRRFRANVTQTFLELFPPPAAPDAVHAVAPNFILALLDGLALHRIADDDPASVTEVLDLAKSLARMFIPDSPQEAPR